MTGSAPIPAAQRGQSSALDQFLQALFWIALACAAVALVAYHVLPRFDETIRMHAERCLQEKLPELAVRVGAARRLEGRGIELRSIAVRLPEAADDSPPLAFLEEAFLSCETDTAKLIAGELDIRGIRLRGAKVRLIRDAAGAWNAAPIFRRPASSSPIPRVTIEESSLEFLDAVTPRREKLVLREIQGVLSPSSAGGAPIHWRGSCTADSLARVSVEAQLGREGWELRGKLERFEWSSRLLAQLPRECEPALRRMSGLRGRTDVFFQIRSAMGSEEPPQFAVEGVLYDGQFEDPRLPFPLQGVQIAYEVNSRGVRITEAAARHGRASFELSGEIQGLHPEAPGHLQLKVTRLALERSWRESLSAESRRIWDRFSPAGLINAQIDLVSQGQGWQPQAKVECLDVAFRYEKFPYPLTGGHGVFWVSKDQFAMHDFHVDANGRDVRIDAEFANPGPRTTGWLEFLLKDPIPLDEHLLAALDPKTEKVVRSLQPGGSVHCWGRVERTDEQSPFQKTLDISLHDCWLTYDRFPYPLHHVSGSIKVVNDFWVLERLVGYNGTACVQGQGRWVPGSPGAGTLTLEFVAWDVPLEDELRGALNSQAQRVWQSLHPRGTVDLLTVLAVYESGERQLHLDIRGEKHVPQENNLEGRNVRIEPDWFPYAIDHLTGSVRYVDGRIEFANVHGRHDDAHLEASGNCHFSADGDWHLQFDELRADRLRADNDLVTAFPVRMGDVIGRLQLLGPISLDRPASSLGGQNRPTLEIAGGNGKPLWMRWDLGLDLENGALGSTLRLEHIHGGIELSGEYDGETLKGRGELQIDSLKYRDVQVTQVRGPLTITDKFISLGTWVEPLPAEKQVRRVTGATLGGGVAGDARIELTEDQAFQIHGSLYNGDLSQASREITSRSRDVSGRMFAEVRLAGTCRGWHTVRGDGTVKLTDADIYELPVMVRMLKLLSVRPPDRAAFTSSDLRFRIEADRVYFDEINVNGDVISLKEGHGEMDLDRNVDLLFYTMVGADRFQLPILRSALRQASPRILVVHVSGSLDDPNVTRELFPNVNESLQQIFPETQRSQSPGTRTWDRLFHWSK